MGMDQVTSLERPIFGDEPSTSLGCSNQFNPEKQINRMHDGWLQVGKTQDHKWRPFDHPFDQLTLQCLKLHKA